MKEIQLTRGYVAIVDDDDYGFLSRLKWFAHTSGKGYVYAATNITDPISKKQRTAKMHRMILGITDPNVCVDHRCGNTLDNRRSNLRTCNKSQNSMNQMPKRNNKLGVKGVYVKPNGRFRAQIRGNGRVRCLGTFETPEAAALAYNEAAKKYHGEFARLNELQTAPTL